MKRYIEIVYDDSGSMGCYLNGRKKYEIAVELLEKEVLPYIGYPDDHVVLRFLGSSCRKGVSEVALNGATNVSILNKISTVSYVKGTPLFYTVYDAVLAAMNAPAAEYLLFIITDGDDTCSVSIETLMDKDTLNAFRKCAKVLLVQLVVQSSISANNLTAFAAYLGGQTVALNGGSTMAAMRSSLKKALNISGFISDLPLAHCFSAMPGKDLSWDELEGVGILYHQAVLLHQKKYLSWAPEHVQSITPLQVAELKFLHGIVFKSAMPDKVTEAMLKQLIKPYYYSSDCIYWDFSAARWKYFKEQYNVKQVDNPDAQLEDRLVEYLDINKDEWLYRENKTYIVRERKEQMDIYFDREYAEYYLELFREDYNLAVKKRAKILKEGDLVTFRSNRKRK